MNQALKSVVKKFCPPVIKRTYRSYLRSRKNQKIRRELFLKMNGGGVRSSSSRNRDD